MMEILGEIIEIKGIQYLRYKTGGWARMIPPYTDNVCLLEGLSIDENTEMDDIYWEEKTGIRINK